MTMSERTITVRLSGPQYRALIGAIAHADNEWEQDGEPEPQARACLDRATRKIVAAWNRNEESGADVPAT